MNTHFRQWPLSGRTFLCLLSTSDYIRRFLRCIFSLWWTGPCELRSLETQNKISRPAVALRVPPPSPKNSPHDPKNFSITGVKWRTQWYPALFWLKMSFGNLFPDHGLIPGNICWLIYRDDPIPRDHLLVRTSEGHQNYHTVFILPFLSSFGDSLTIQLNVKKAKYCIHYWPHSFHQVRLFPEFLTCLSQQTVGSFVFFPWLWGKLPFQKFLSFRYGF